LINLLIAKNITKRITLMQHLNTIKTTNIWADITVKARHEISIILREVEVYKK
tara:strand:- start:1083 stop:1241 length:159 start_codon:yes stop_codon:yes gene_type:complete